VVARPKGMEPRHDIRTRRWYKREY
jgi:hypothetical protein